MKKITIIPIQPKEEPTAEDSLKKIDKSANIVSLFGEDLSAMAKEWEIGLHTYPQYKGFKLEHKKKHLFITNIYNKLGEHYEITVKRNGDLWKINVTNTAHKEEYFYETNKILEENMKDEIGYIANIIENDFLDPRSKLQKEDLLNINLDDWM